MNLTLTKLPANSHYICLSEESAITLVDKQLVESKTERAEAWEQKKIMDALELVGFQVDKNVVSNKAGNSDITACSLVGQMWKIEVKKAKKGKLAPLQRAKLLLAWQNNVVVMVAYGYEDFKAKFRAIKEASRNDC